MKADRRRLLRAFGILILWLREKVKENMFGSNVSSAARGTIEPALALQKVRRK
jgi:hypothetical protein